MHHSLAAFMTGGDGICDTSTEMKADTAREILHVHKEPLDIVNITAAAAADVASFKRDVILAKLRRRVHFIM